MTRLRKYAPVVAVALIVPISIAAWWTVTFGRLTPVSTPPAPSEGMAPAPKLVRIEPGTIVEDTAPKGWSSRIIKTVLSLKSGDVDSLPEFATQTATRLRTVLLADVRRGSDGYRLRRLGVGLAMKHKGRDAVVSSDSLDPLGVEVSTLDKIVLSRAEQALDRGRLAARTPTFVVYDASVEYFQAKKHRSIYLRYAIVVDPASGRLRTLVWPIAQVPLERKKPSEMILLPPNTLFRCGVHVQATRLPGGIPVAWYFAMDGLPPGKRLPMPPELQKWATIDPETGEQSTRFEAAVRRALQDSLSGEKNSRTAKIP